MTSIFQKLLDIFKKQSKKEPQSITIHVMGKEYSIMPSTNKVSTDELSRIQKKQAARRKRGNRQDRRRAEFRIYEYAISLIRIQTAQSFFELDKAIIDYNRAIHGCNEERQNLNENHIATIIRFCKHQHAIGNCDYVLSTQDIENIYNWEGYRINYGPILNTLSSSYKLYWDNVIQNYKRNSDRQKRIQSIILQLEEMPSRKGLAFIPNINDIFNEIICYYQSLV